MTSLWPFLNTAPSLSTISLFGLVLVLNLYLKHPQESSILSNVKTSESSCNFSSGFFFKSGEIFSNDALFYQDLIIDYPCGETEEY